jgi:hypothetical protein
VARHFIPVALDTYFRGSSDEVEFCEGIGAGGNHLAAATAGGRRLGKGADLRLRERELSRVLDEFRALPEAERRPELSSVEAARPPERPVPSPPRNGTVLRGYCSYLEREPSGKLVRAKRFYYEENPDRWAAETQSDILWLTEEETRSLVPADLRDGSRVDATSRIQKRLFGTLGIDYMEGSVNSLAVRESSLTLTVESVSGSSVGLRIDGYAKLGKAHDETKRKEPRSRGCELRIIGRAVYDREKGAFTRFDLAGAGMAWGCKMDYVDREIRIREHPWWYGVACELVSGSEPMDRIPPYNMLHYGGREPYLGE